MSSGRDPILDALNEAARTERAPLSLRLSVDELRSRPATRRPRPRLAVAGIGVLAALAVILTFALPGGSPGGPSIAQAAAVGLRLPQTAAPRPDPANPARLLDLRVGTLAFPTWTGSGWRAVGRRTDTINGRRVETVYYQRLGGHPLIAYTIVSGKALAPRGRVSYDFAFKLDGRFAITWREDGHTCILSSTAVPAAGLWRLSYHS